MYDIKELHYYQYYFIIYTLVCRPPSATTTWRHFHNTYIKWTVSPFNYSAYGELGLKW